MLKCPVCGTLIDEATDSAVLDIGNMPMDTGASVSLGEAVLSDGKFQIGDRVRVLPPFDFIYPDVMTVDDINSETGSYRIAGDRDFASVFLQKVEV